MRSRHTWPLAVALLLGTAACGDGKWGAEITVVLDTTDASDVALAPGVTLAVGHGHHIEVDRACLTLDTVVVAPVSEDTGDGEPSESCFCHGDPPHCHGDCGDGVEGAANPPLVRAVQRIVDLLGGEATVVTGGAAPGEYDTVTLALSRAPEDVATAPTACADLAGRTFVLEGTLVDSDSGQRFPLTIDLRATDKVSEAIRTATPMEATVDGGRIRLRLRLDVALGAVDWRAVVPDGQNHITVGGPLQLNVLAAGEVLGGLTAAASWTLGDPSNEES